MISVIVPTYNEEKNIERCLKSLENQTIPRNKFEVIIVDGQSKDRTVDIAKKYADKVIQQKSKGVGGARNDGVEIARGNIIAVTDADSILFKNWIERVQKNFKEKVVIGTFGFLKPIDFNGVRKLEKIIYEIVFEISNILLILMAKIGYYHLCGSNCAFRRETFLKIGGYSHLPYSDDIEIMKRLKPFGEIILDKRMRVKYSVRRIKKMGMKKYILLILRNDFITMILNMKPITGNYSRQEYS